MPKSPVQRVLRVVVPLSILLAGIVIAIAIGRATAPSTPTPAPPPDQVARDTEPETTPDRDPDPAREREPDPDPDPAEGREPAPEPRDAPEQPDAPEVDPPEAEPEAGFSLDGLRARVFEDEPREPDFDTLGGLDPDGVYRMAIRFSRYGAGISGLDLATHFDTIERLDHTTLQREYDHADPVTGAVDGVTPFSALRILIGEASIPLQAVPDDEGYEQRIWRQTEPGVFEAQIINENDEPVLRIERRFELDPDSYEFRLRQRIDNLTDGPLNVRLIQHGPTQLRQEAAYGGEHRRVRFGYLESITRDPAQNFVVADSDLMRRNRAIETEDPTLWPNQEAIERDRTLVWLAQTNRYFGVAAYPLIDPTQDRPPKAFGTVQSIQRAVLRRGLTEPILTLQLNGTDLRLEPGDSGRIDMAVFAGPLSTPLINRHDRAKLLGIDGLVTFSFGGPCAWCTFTWLTEPLLGLLRFLQAYLVLDWALAIICLVVIVRSILHPVTRWSQSRMLIFGKQMQELGPKQRKIQEKYKHDRKQLQQEMAKLWREEGVSPAGFLGCLPMLLQTPIWIALYAMLFYAVELRHEAAFFGLFQGVTGGHWRFLGDLSEADRAIWFGGAGFSIPILSNLWGSVNSINILPLILGLVFYVHQKYMTPQSLDTMTPEQQQQQKIMRVMMVVLFPLIMYNAPSGLALYFIANSSLGIVESRWIRSNLEKRGMLDIENIRKHKQSKPGFLQRVQQAAEYQQQKKALKQGKVPPPGAGGGRAVRRAAAKQAQRKEDAPTPDRFKKKKKRR